MAKKKSTLKNLISDSPIALKPTKADIERENKWRAEEDVRTLQRASEIKSDKERMSAAKKIAKEQMTELKKIC